VQPRRLAVRVSRTTSYGYASAARLHPVCIPEPIGHVLTSSAVTPYQTLVVRGFKGAARMGFC